MAKAIVTAEYIRERLSYDPETGIFTKNYDFGSRFRKGDRADMQSYRKNKSYRRIYLAGEWYWAHRVVFMYLNNEWPDGDVDHINGDPSDNRLSNLRVVDHGTNQQNRRLPSVRNKTGYLGVQKVGSKFWASISHKKKTISIGFFESAEAAHFAYVQVKREIHKGCTI